MKAESSGQAVGINYGTVIQQNFTGAFALLKDATISLDPLPADIGLVDPANPDDLLGLFSGRKWLIEEIDTFVDGCVKDRVGGHLFIEAEAGMGKSALAAYLAFTRHWPTHVTRLPGGTSPETARLNLAAQTIARWQLADAAPGGVLPTGSDTTVWLYQRLCDAKARRDDVEPDVPVVLLVDGLDEAPQAAAGELPLGLPKHVPAGCAVVAMTRPGVRLPVGVGRVKRIPVESQLNRDDLATYLKSAVGKDPQLREAITRAKLSQEVFCRRLLNASGGVWIYAVMVLDQIRQGRSASDVSELPVGLASYYTDNIDRWHDDPTVAWPDVGLPLLAMLAAAREPLPGQQLAAWAGLPVAAVRTVLRGPFKPFLATRPGGDPDLYAIRHQSLRDMCHGQLPIEAADASRVMELAHDLAEEVRHAHGQIADALTPSGPNSSRDWTSIDDYTRLNLPEHAAAAGTLDDLVVDPGFLLACPLADILRRRQYLTTDVGRTAVAALELAANSWSDPDTRVNWLQVSARKLRCDFLADAIVAGRPGWSARWAFWQGSAHRQLAGHTGEVERLVVVEVPDGRRLLASGDSRGAVLLWDPVTGQRHAELAGHIDNARALRVMELPDGRQLLASGGRDGVVRLWDPVTGQPHAELAGHPGGVWHLVMVDLPDGRRLLAAGGHDGVVRLWDPATGEPNAELAGHTDEICELTVVELPDGRRLLASGDRQGVVRLWDPATGEQHAELAGHTKMIWELAVVELPDGRPLLASSDSGGMVRLWDPVTGQEHAEISAHTGKVTALVAVETPDGRQLLASACDADDIVRLWDPITGHQHAQLTSYSDGRLLVVELPDGRQLLATSTRGGMILLWDPATGQKHAQFDGHDTYTWVLAVIEADDGRRLLASGGADSMVRLWDPATGKRHAELPGHIPWCGALAVVNLPDGRQLLASGDGNSGTDGSVRLWDPVAIQHHIEQAGHTDDVEALAVVKLPDRRQILASGGRDGMVMLWDPVTGHQHGKMGGRTNGFHTGGVGALTVVELPDGRQLIASGDGGGDNADEGDGIVLLWDPATGHLHSELEGHSQWVHTLVTVKLPDDSRQLLASCDRDGTVRLWDPATGHQHAGPIDTGGAWTLAVVELPDGRQLIASGDYDGTVRLWDPVTGHQRAEVGTPGYGMSAMAVVKLSARRQLLAVGYDDGTASFCDPVAGQASELKGCTGGLLGVVELPNGRQLLASRHGKSAVRLWDPVTGHQHAELVGQTSMISALAVVELPDRQRLLASGDYEGIVRLWDPITGHQRAELVGHTNKVSALAVMKLSDGQQLLASAGDRAVIVWAFT